MSESNLSDQIDLHRKLSTIAQLEVPVPITSPTHSLFVQRQIAARKYLTERFSEVGQEELLHYIEYCNESIKKYLGL